MTTAGPDVLILGAGISGLAAARTLTAAGVSCSLVDKSRGVGGRCATRRFHGTRFDHGAQFFTARDDAFKREIEASLARPHVREWYRGNFATNEAGRADQLAPVRYCGTEGINGLAKALADDLTVERQVQIAGLVRSREGWCAYTEHGACWEARAVIATLPLPQLLDILEDPVRSDLLGHVPELETVVYDPCFAVMLALRGPSRLPAPGGLRVDGPVIDWIADNTMKHGLDGPGALTIHTSRAFTREFFDAAPEQVVQMVQQAAVPWLNAEVDDWQVHRWRYARPANPLEVGALRLGPGNPLVLAGDYLNGAPRVEAAFLSGVAAANQLLSASG